MMRKAVEREMERAEDLDLESKLERAIEILMKKLDISEREAKMRIATFSKMKDLDTEKTCEVLIRLEKIISESWFEKSTAH